MKKMVENSAPPRRMREMQYAPAKATSRVIGTTHAIYWSVRRTDDQKAEFFNKFV
jgi:hypothetical protein